MGETQQPSGDFINWEVLRRSDVYLHYMREALMRTLMSSVPNLDITNITANVAAIMDCKSMQELENLCINKWPTLNFSELIAKAEKNYPEDVRTEEMAFRRLRKELGQNEPIN